MYLFVCISVPLKLKGYKAEGNTYENSIFENTKCTVKSKALIGWHYEKKLILSSQTDLIRYKKVLISTRENLLQPHYALIFLRISGSYHIYDTLNKNIIKTEAASLRCS